MAHYFKITEDDYIVLIGTGSGGEGISPEEYERILTTINRRPVAPPGFTYRLRGDLTWELHELVATQDPEEAGLPDGEAGEGAQDAGNYPADD